MLTYWETLIATRSNITVSDSYAELWGRKLSNAYTVATYIGTLPATLQTVEGYLESYKIYGDTAQSGTPTPENPIIPSGCGERVDITGLNEPLCGIGTYTDSLELSTGILTRKIKKQVLKGTNVDGNIGITAQGVIYITPVTTLKAVSNGYCTHYKFFDRTQGPSMPLNSFTTNGGAGRSLWFKTEFDNVADFKAYLASEYIAGTPVTVWYVLSEPEVSTIPVPSGLTGTIDGYLIQDGTPAPETPIYPTANGVKQADDTYSIVYGYKLPLTSNSTPVDIYIGDDTLSAEEYVDSTTGKIYRRTKNLSPPEEEWIDGQIGGGDGTVSPSTQIKVSPFIDVSTCETCIMEVFSAETEWAAAGYREMAFYDENKQYLDWIGGGGRQTLTPNSFERLSEFPAGTVYVRIGCSHGDQPFYPQLASGYTPTHQFYPYLVPTDPPVPFLQIPTAAGTTVIDYAGEGLAPSEVELVYKVKR